MLWPADGVGERLRGHRHADPSFWERSEAVSPLLAWRGRWRLPHIWGAVGDGRPSLIWCSERITVAVNAKAKFKIIPEHSTIRNILTLEWFHGVVHRLSTRWTWFVKTLSLELSLDFLLRSEGPITDRVDGQRSRWRDIDAVSSTFRSTWSLNTSGARTFWCEASTWRIYRLTRRALSPSSTSCLGWTVGFPPRPGRCWTSAGTEYCRTRTQMTNRLLLFPPSSPQCFSGLSPSFTPSASWCPAEGLYSLSSWAFSLPPPLPSPPPTHVMQQINRSALPGLAREEKEKLIQTAN